MYQEVWRAAVGEDLTYVTERPVTSEIVTLLLSRKGHRHSCRRRLARTLARRLARRLGKRPQNTRQKQGTVVNELTTHAYTKHM